ncbi:MAG: CoA pyrophosphatase [Rhizomicrobium sp.]|jgi:8-oxo-dGTP pyrophosphatase MutT (NUDIX family)
MSGAPAIGPEEIVRRICEHGLDYLKPRLLSEPPVLPLSPKRSDFDLNPDMKPEKARTLVPAAVLLPIVKRPNPTLLFTQRTATLARHAGQVSFPGGRVNDDDESLVQTALRETTEETGIAAGFVSVAGFLEPYETGTGFAILPVVGHLSEGFALNPNPEEVADVFEVPLDFLLNPANRVRRAADWQGRRREFYAYTYDDHYIWGATAAILVEFSQRMQS